MKNISEKRVASSGFISTLTERLSNSPISQVLAIPKFWCGVSVRTRCQASSYILEVLGSPAQFYRSIIPTTAHVSSYGNHFILCPALRSVSRVYAAPICGASTYSTSGLFLRMKRATLEARGVFGKRSSFSIMTNLGPPVARAIQLRLLLLK